MKCTNPDCDGRGYYFQSANEGQIGGDDMDCPTCHGTGELPERVEEKQISGAFPTDLGRTKQQFGESQSNSGGNSKAAKQEIRSAGMSKEDNLSPLPGSCGEIAKDMAKCSSESSASPVAQTLDSRRDGIPDQKQECNSLEQSAGSIPAESTPLIPIGFSGVDRPLTEQEAKSPEDCVFAG